MKIDCYHISYNKLVENTRNIICYIMATIDDVIKRNYYNMNFVHDIILIDYNHKII